jgi:hypothetical protein
MSSMRFNTCLDKSCNGLLHLFKDAGVVADGLMGINNALVKSLFVANRISIHKGF